jgi:hypothetical protein
MSCRPASQRTWGFILVASAFIAFSVGGWCGETLYHFVDERGVQHFSNHPLEPRYRPLLPTPDAAGPGQPATRGAPEVAISAPDQVALGEIFEVTLSMADPPAGAGYVEVTFDPEAISLQAISTEASITEPGRLRVELSLQPGQGEILVSLSFQAIAALPTRAALQVTQLELRAPDGKALAGSGGAWAIVHLVN